MESLPVETDGRGGHGDQTSADPPVIMLPPRSMRILLAPEVTR